MTLPHHKLVAWQRADDLYVELYRLTLQRFPPHARFELGGQIRRAAYSVAANLVEGSERLGQRDRLRFFNFASASLAEAAYGVHASHRLGYVSDETYAALERQIIGVAAPLQGLIRPYRAIDRARRRARNEEELGTDIAR